MSNLLKKIWYFTVYYFKLIFFRDPVQEWIEEFGNRLESGYRDRIKDLERQVEYYRLDLQKSREDYLILQQKFLEYLKEEKKPAAQVPIPISPESYSNRPTSFAFRRQKLEERSKKNVHERIAEIETEVLGSPDEQTELVPSAESHGI